MQKQCDRMVLRRGVAHSRKMRTHVAAALLHTNEKEGMYGPQDTSERLHSVQESAPPLNQKRKRSKRGLSRSLTAALNKKQESVYKADRFVMSSSG